MARWAARTSRGAICAQKTVAAAGCGRRCTTTRSKGPVGRRSAHRPQDARKRSRCGRTRRMALRLRGASSTSRRLRAARHDETKDSHTCPSLCLTPTRSSTASPSRYREQSALPRWPAFEIYRDLSLLCMRFQGREKLLGPSSRVCEGAPRSRDSAEGRRGARCGQCNPLLGQGLARPRTGRQFLRRRRHRGQSRDRGLRDDHRLRTGGRPNTRSDDGSQHRPLRCKI